MYGKIQQHLKDELLNMNEAGLCKTERFLTSPQGAEISLKSGQKVLNFCSNNYLGLSSHPKVIEAAKRALDDYGYGMSSVRFICGTQIIHKELEEKISNFFEKEDTILYSSAFDANVGIFEPILTERDAIISDTLNHASIIDGVRLCKAHRYRYEHSDMEDLEVLLKRAQAQRFRIIVTDGVFSMDGDIAKLTEICKLAEKYDALVMVDDSHASGFIGKAGRGTPEYHNVLDKVDIITSTLGKALGGAMGGFTTGKKEIIELLRQKSRPYLFSNSLSPVIVGAANAIFDMLDSATELRDKLENNAMYFRREISKVGFDIKPTQSAIVAIMLYDAKIAQKFAEKLMNEEIYVSAFMYPVVPKGEARIRVQLSAAHEKSHLERAVKAFTKIGKEIGVL